MYSLMTDIVMSGQLNVVSDYVVKVIEIDMID